MITLFPLDPPPGRATRTRPAARLLVTTVAAFALALGVLSLLDRTPAGPPAPPAPTVGASRGGTDTGAEVRRLQAAVRMAPEAAGPRAQLAAAYLQRARETGDPSFYVRAEGLVRSALARDPGNAEATVQAGTLALARHDFSSALVLAQRAQRQSGGAGAVAPYPVLVDALVELGRYDEAERALQAMVDLKPNLAAYARVSYLRELHGDLDGAAAAMRDAIAAGGPVPEHVASLQTLLAGLELARGRPGAARRATDAALAAVPGYVPALAEDARLRASRGDLGGAVAAWRRVVARRPLPEYVTALGEAELAAGRRARARRDLALVGVQRRLPAAGGVNTDVERAAFEADHGDPRRGVALGRRGWAAAPSVRSADALGWALTRSGRPREGLAWARRALRLGSLDPLLRFHAGMSARAVGRPHEARAHLRTALAHGLRATPWQARQAREALR